MKFAKLYEVTIDHPQTKSLTTLQVLYRLIHTVQDDKGETKTFYLLNSTVEDISTDGFNIYVSTIPMDSQAALDAAFDKIDEQRAIKLANGMFNPV